MAIWAEIDWSQTIGGNDKFGDCAFVSLANLTDILKTPQVVMDAEIERFYALETGWTPLDPLTDKGAILEAVIKDWCINGWPTDPVWKPTGYETFAPANIAAALDKYVACPCILMLPENEDFTDASLGLPGTMGHAVLVVQASDTEVRFITWGRIVVVSMAWWRKFARTVYGVQLST